MCGRFTLTSTPEQIAEELELALLPSDYFPRYNIAPLQPVLVVRREEDGERGAALLRWGLVPFWAKEPLIGNRMINARAETIAEKPAYKNAFAKRRCLVLADGFYEWQRVGGRKVPMWIHRTDGRPFAFAGIWERWRGEDEALETCAIITTGPNALMRSIHDRMPVILSREERERWLDLGAEPGELRALLCPCAAGDFTAHAVSTLVNSPANNRPECIEAADER